MKSYSCLIKKRDPRLPRDWAVYSIESIGAENAHIKISGAIAYIPTKGKDKRRLRWRKPFQQHFEYIFSDVEFSALYSEWELIDKSLIDKFGNKVESKHSEAIATARAAHADFDQLEAAWGL